MAGSNYQRLAALDGPRRFERLCRLLEGVQRTGSLHRAAMAFGCSYRHAWGLVKQAEAHLGTPLLDRRIGGSAGGGALLTSAGHELLARFQRLQDEVEPQVASILEAAEPRPAPGAAAGAAPVPGGPLLIASTIGPVETGLLPVLEEAFRGATGLWVRHVSAGSGQALEIARGGSADLVLAHAPDVEADFIAQGYALRRRLLMVGEYVLCGPALDPARVRMAPDVVTAMARIAAARHPFVTRGDQSGTHLRELALWAAAGVTPTLPWYTACTRGGDGSVAAVHFAAEHGAYTLVDRSAWVAARTPSLPVLLAGDPQLLNPFSLLELNPERFPRRDCAGGSRFAQWATGPQGQQLVAAYGRDRFGTPLFRPVAAARASP